MTDAIEPGWELAEGITLHPMPFGGGFVLDRARLEAEQVGIDLAGLLTGDAPYWLGSLVPLPAGLAAELRRGSAEGWLIRPQAPVGEAP
ncbi:hypothetical protein [Streptomyces sp. MZ04]|uniref:hypothetical protein n=1 Tax=Streptomyces sp. MZ04 TaxID=2559236 RepID=UPI00107E78BB|nr:hypothetical protein [Streptomyces sp. MZ04]TGA94383.1 hypothetical protein E2651_35320 [Streptomyces sp. MZ04]